MIQRFLLCAALTVVAVPAWAQAPVPLVVHSDWLAQQLNDPKVVILHLGRDYDTGHIPGARLLSGEPTIAGLAALGVSKDSHIVVSATGRDVPAMMMFALDALGLSRVSLLDGGLDAWTKAGKPMTRDVPRITPGTLTAPPPKNLIVDAEFVKSVTSRPNHKLVDARAPVFYQGIEGMHGKAGHIAGAVNIPHADVASATVDRDRLERIFRAAGINPGDTVVAYCHVGQYARWVLFAARVLGHPVRLYAGSFHDWTSNDRGPLVK
jgi:thiosulfate/3-mercaptopyruvate sulfurtransferase